MQITGDMLTAGQPIRGSADPVFAVEPATGRTLDPPFPGDTVADADQACASAWEAFGAYRETSLDERARCLEAMGKERLAPGDVLIERACAEPGHASAGPDGPLDRFVESLGGARHEDRGNPSRHTAE